MTGMPPYLKGWQTHYGSYLCAAQDAEGGEPSGRMSGKNPFLQAKQMASA